MNIALILSIIIGAGVVSLVNFLALRRYIEGKHRALSELLGNYRKPAVDGGPSPFTIFAETWIQRLGEVVSEHLKASTMGLISGISKTDRQIEAAILEDSSPIASLLANSNTAVGKLIRKNPQAAGRVLSLVGQAMGGNKPAGNNHSDKIIQDLLKEG